MPGLTCSHRRDFVTRQAMTNYKITVSYDGAVYFGWQRLKDKPTIQGTIEDTLGDVFHRPCLIHGASRTDRGAHAEGQVFNVVLPGELGIEAMKRAIDGALPSAIRVLAIEAVESDFHALKSARGKIYRYVIWNAPECPADLEGRVWHIPVPLAVEPMRGACQVFVGERDFASFATRPNFKQKSTRRHVRRVSFVDEGAKISITIEADGFLYKMVRNVVRAIVKVGEGRINLEDLRVILDARDRKAAPGTAPASGLYLDAVHYE
jgi:tRNA pseudouridine38-40 synthase